MARVRSFVCEKNGMRITVVDDGAGHVNIALEAGARRVSLGNTNDLWAREVAASIRTVEGSSRFTDIIDAMTDHYVDKGYMSAESAERAKAGFNPSTKGDSKNP